MLGCYRLQFFIYHMDFGVLTSLGMKHGDTSKEVQSAAYIFAILLMLAFIFIPLYILITGGQGSLISY